MAGDVHDVTRQHGMVLQMLHGTLLHVTREVEDTRLLCTDIYV